MSKPNPAKVIGVRRTGKNLRTNPRAWKMDKIRRYREMSIAEISALTGLTYTVVQRMNSGNFSIKSMSMRNLILVSRALRCRACDLIPGLLAVMEPLPQRPPPGPLAKSQFELEELREMGRELSDSIEDETHIQEPDCG